MILINPPKKAPEEKGRPIRLPITVEEGGIQRNVDLIWLILKAKEHLPPLVWGAPGVAKTSVIEQIAHALDYHFISILPALYEPGDLHGFPVPREDMLEFVPPDWAKDAIDIAESGEKKGVLILFDELTAAPPQNQAALTRLFLERRIGKYKFPSNIELIAAANPPHQAIEGYKLAFPLLNRTTQIEWTNPTPQEWRDFMLKKERGEPLTFEFLEIDYGQNDQNYKKYLELAIDAISYYQELTKFTTKIPQQPEESGLHQFASFRTLSYAAHIYAVVQCAYFRGEKELDANLQKERDVRVKEELQRQKDQFDIKRRGYLMELLKGLVGSDVATALYKVIGGDVQVLEIVRDVWEGKRRLHEKDLESINGYAIIIQLFYRATNENNMERFVEIYEDLANRQLRKDALVAVFNMMKAQNLIMKLKPETLAKLLEAEHKARGLLK
jgi:MoxR-like ATPase